MGLFLLLDLFKGKFFFGFLSRLFWLETISFCDLLLLIDREFGAFYYLLAAFFLLDFSFLEFFASFYFMGLGLLFSLFVTISNPL